MVIVDSPPSAFQPNAVSNRFFGLLMGFMLCTINGVFFASGKGPSSALLSVGVLLLGFGVFAPTLLEYPKRAWFFITHKISLIVSFLLLATIFFCVVTPVGLIFRVIGRDPLQRKWEPNRKSYWEIKEKKPLDMRLQY